MPVTLKEGRRVPAEAATSLEAAFTEALFASALPGELENLDANARAGIARFVANVAAKRPPGTHIVHLDSAETEGPTPIRRPR